MKDTKITYPDGR